MFVSYFLFFFFFFNDTATTEIYTLSLHDALPISRKCYKRSSGFGDGHNESARGMVEIVVADFSYLVGPRADSLRSEEHTSELQSQSNLVCRLLLEKKKKKRINEKYRICNRTMRPD